MNEQFHKGQLVVYLGQWVAQIVGLSKTAGEGGERGG